MNFKEYNKLMALLSKLKIEDVLLLYIEAKTGSLEDIDKLPVSLLQAIEELGVILNRFNADRLYADKVIKNLFKD